MRVLLSFEAREVPRPRRQAQELKSVERVVSFEALLQLGPSGRDLLVEVGNNIALSRCLLREGGVVLRGAFDAVRPGFDELDTTRLLIHVLSVDGCTDKGRRGAPLPAAQGARRMATFEGNETMLRFLRSKEEHVIPQPFDQQTYVPAAEEKVGEVLSFIKAHEDARSSRPADRYFLAGPGEGDQVELPESVYRAVHQVVEAMAAGKAVTVAPQNQLLTTQQAADLLGVSRPTVIKLIDDGELPAETPGTRRRMIKLDDVLACKARRREAQYNALMALAVEDYDADEDPEKVAEDLRRIRAEVAARRRARAKA